MTRPNITIGDLIVRSFLPRLLRRVWVIGPDYKAMENRLQAAIHLRFGLPAIVPAALKTLFKKADHLSVYARSHPIGRLRGKRPAACSAPPPKTVITPRLLPLPTAEAQSCSWTGFTNSFSTC